MKIININTKEILEVEQEHLIAVLKHNKNFKVYNENLELLNIEDKKENDIHNQNQDIEDKEEIDINNQNQEEQKNEENINTKSDNVDNEKIIQKKQKKTRSKNIEDKKESNE